VAHVSILGGDAVVADLQLRERIDHLLISVDQYRRSLSARPTGSH
jgi:hypothetical protein